MATNATTFSLGDMVCIDANADNVGKVLDMRTRHGALDYLIEHPGHTEPGSTPPDHGDAEWIAAERLQLAKDARRP